ncbi:MAG: ribonuclease HII [SAR202 cluster bacterium]|nr:ribonuclease HII [Dehalococcoidia bacterium]MQG55449.1 ribonuclease HII [SAR202 cluster bacterium]|tara:strand:- start:68994 stop:69632 length:639 start_codon:yes stop_codon:yes gene_type:complete
MPDLSLEFSVRRRGIQLVAGVDEAGRGPLAGPVVAAAVILPPGLTGSELWLQYLDDSKKLSHTRREHAADIVHKHALAVGVGLVGPEDIDRMGIGQAALAAMLRAVDQLPLKPGHLLLDFIYVRECAYTYDTIVKGDSRSYSIAAASNVAKVTRDRLMVEAEEIYPGYHFARHKGYPTKAHFERLNELGPCPIHRRSFAPVAQACMQFSGDG